MCKSIPRHFYECGLERKIGPRCNTEAADFALCSKDDRDNLVVVRYEILDASARELFVYKYFASKGGSITTVVMKL